MMHCPLKYVPFLLLLALSKTHKCGLAKAEIVEFSGPLTCMEDGENFPFPDQTCRSRESPYSCSTAWRLRPCKCDDDCALFDECCPDVNGMNASKTYPHPKTLPDKMAWEDSFVPYMTCEATRYEQYLKNENLTLSQYFFLIGRCPDYVPRDSDIRLYCEEPPTSDDIFVTPMTVESIGHFKNYFCAMCHGVGSEVIKPWVWKWRCDGVLDGLDSSLDDYEPTYTEQYLVSLKICSRALESISNIPDNITPRSCYPGVDVTMCSPTYHTDSSTQMKCPSYLAPVEFNGTVYKNLACAYCNGIDVCRNHTGLCNSIGLGDAITEGFPSLAEFFAFNPSSDQSAVSSCAFNEAFDPIIRACQVVYCLSGFVYNGTTGRCERLPVDEIGGVCLSFYSHSNGQTEVNITSSDIEYLTGAMNSLIISTPYDVLASTMVVGLPQISCKLSENDFYDDERCYEQNETIACQICFKVEMNFTVLIASNLSHVVNTSLSFNDTSCYFTPSFGNISVTQMVIDVPADWACDSYSSFFSGHTNDTLLPPFKVEILREAGEYEMNVLSGEYICRDNLTLTCEKYAMEDPEYFERVVTDDSEEAISLRSGDTVLTQDKFQVIPNGSVIYCLDETEQSSRVLPRGLDIMTLVGTILSMISVLVVIATYTVFSKLRNMAGKSVLALSVALLITFLLMSLSAVSSSNKNFCKAMAAATHFFWLSIFFWMNAMAIDLNRTFGSRAKIRIGSKSQIFYVWYSLYAWGTPALIVGACLIIDLCDCTTLSFEYGSDELCWLSRGDANLYGFGVPLAALLFLNTILFSDTVVGIRLTKKASEKAVKERPALARAKEELSLYIKLSCVMGFTWIFAFVCEYANVPELWYVFTAVNSLQGVFILFAFGFNKRVTALWRDKLGIKRKEVTSSSQGDTKSTNTQNSTVG